MAIFSENLGFSVIQLHKGVSHSLFIVIFSSKCPNLGHIHDAIGKCLNLEVGTVPDDIQ